MFLSDLINKTNRIFLLSLCAGAAASCGMYAPSHFSENKIRVEEEKMYRKLRWLILRRLFCKGLLRIIVSMEMVLCR